MPLALTASFRRLVVISLLSKIHRPIGSHRVKIFLGEESVSRPQLVRRQIPFGAPTITACLVEYRRRASKTRILTHVAQQRMSPKISV